MLPGGSGGTNAESMIMLSHSDAGPMLDLTHCEREPIHIPNAIQPHGAFIAASVVGLQVTHASANLERFFGLTPDAVFGLYVERAGGRASLPHAALDHRVQSDHRGHR